MDNRTLLIMLHQTDAIGWKTILRIVSLFSELIEAVHVTSADWLQLGLTEARANAVAKAFMEATTERVETVMEKYRSRQIEIITIFDDNYPYLLKQTAEPPWVLYVRGRLELLNSPSIGIVGTRNPTVYGRKIAEQFSEELSAANVCVISGLARGIDSSAHVGALRQKGGTIAVLGCGIDHIYPPENKSLYMTIAEQGLLVSEYPLNTKSHPGMFPKRNRIIAGLSFGIVVVEAALKSGSLITADQALEESRDVFAIPGPVSSPKSQGTLALIKQGAKLVSCVDDILEEYRHRITSDPTRHSKHEQEEQPKLTVDEQIITELLQQRPLSIDELLMGSQFTFGHLHAVLLNLLLTKRVEQLPGSLYAIC
ncbi:DNA-processing protein DprA [Paenibacillus sp. FSL H7-0331]|uniref:DNA-processing protein DprA n=1 Tax=Paenibacillus sp. FSL H7-0331 TaxID=1920421 RepID=UPI00096C6156|nr:DNA-processing protein DprA [Paenibacillus sp. FSL H7-0331]OMF14594.1 DNA protecting protein DprA [Paenibacillus sp. FSL H7-0331]